MTRTKPSAQMSSGRAAFSPRTPRTAPGRRCRGVFAFAGLLAIAALLPAGAASADGRIGQAGTGPGGLGEFAADSVAVSSQQGGDIYALGAGTADSQRVDEFEPDGTPVLAFGFGVLDGAAELQTCTITCHETVEGGSAPGQLNWSDEIAVDNSCAEHQPPLTESTSPKCSEFDHAYGDVYVVDQRDFRVERYSPEGHFELMFGGEVDKGPHHPGDLCTAAYIAEGDTCGAGVPGTGPAHFYKESYPIEWNDEGNNSIAVGPDGRVYVGDYGRIQEFAPSGTFTGEFKLPVQGGENPQFVVALAIDSAGDIFERSAVYGGPEGQEVVSQVPGVREFSPARALLNTFDAEEPSSEPTRLALDREGDLFLSDYGNGLFSASACNGADSSGCPEETFRAYKPNGALYAIFSSDQVLLRRSAAVWSEPAGISVGDEAARLYVPASLPAGPHIAAVLLPKVGPPIVKQQEASDIEPETTILHALINPKGFDTNFHFEFGKTEAYGRTTADEDLGALIRDDPAQVAISALQPGITYHWRAVAESECEPTADPGHICVIDGTDETLQTLPPVSVRDFTTQTVGPELVTLKAELNPNNSDTHYTIRYGREDGDYSEGSTEGVLHISNQFEVREVTFSGLQPNTTYHYQLVAENGYTSPGNLFETHDQEFTTEETIAEQDAAAACPNAQLRSENGSLALPDCRAYERVSPAFKGDSGVLASASSLASGGERVAFHSNGVFAGEQNVVINDYLARRTETGWLTQPVNERPSESEFNSGQTQQLDPELEHWLNFSTDARTAAEKTQLGVGRAYYLGGLDGSFVKATPTLAPLPGEGQGNFEIMGTSTDFSHIFLLGSDRLLSTDPRPTVNGGSGFDTDRIYEVSEAGAPTPAFALVAEVPPGLPQSSSCTLDSVAGGQSLHTVSADGSLLLYTGPVESVPGAECEGGVKKGPNKAALFACHVAAGSCVEGQPGYHPAVQLSAKSSTQCSSPHPCYTAAPGTALYDGASPDGRLAWFTTSQPLVDADSDSGEGPAADDLYIAKLTASGQVEELIQASHGESTDPTPGAEAGVQKVLRLSADGQAAVFLATGVLTAEPNSTGESAAHGAENLYLYDAATAKTSFLARLCSGSEESGSVHDSSCPDGRRDPATAEQAEVPPIGLTPDNRYVVFSSYARLIPEDTDSAADLYRYDTQTGKLIRVSVARRGNDGDGNDSRYDALPGSSIVGSGEFAQADLAAEDSSRFVSANGSIVLFETTAPLVSRDTNEAPDLYEWEEDGHGTCNEAGGCISLLTDGVDPHGVAHATARIGSSGRDLIFTTPSSLVPGDADGLNDVYDARENGGFPYSPPPIPCGGAETCRHEPPASPPPPKISSEGETTGNGLRQLRCAKGKVRIKKHGQVRCATKKHHHKKHGRANASRRAGK